MNYARKLILYFNRRINYIHVYHKTFETDETATYFNRTNKTGEIIRILNREIIDVHDYHKTAETDKITMI